MKVQKTAWGQIEWFPYTQEGAGHQENMTVGLVTLREGGYEEPHVHYEEQMLYVLEGEAIAHINGQEYRMRPGDLFHWPPGVIDEVQAIGKGPFRHLMASNPLHLEEQMLIKREEELGEEALDRESLVNLLYVAVEAIRTQFLEQMHYAYAIFDDGGNMVHKSKYFPTHCLQCCSPSILFGVSPCMVSQKGESQEQEKTIDCKYGTKVISVPIFYRGHYLGHIKGGFIRQSHSSDQTLYGVYDTPESNVQAIRSLLEKIAKAMENYCEFAQFRRQLSQRDLEIALNMESKRVMEENLKQAEYLMTDLKINNHFLFNTLNSMASMALDGGNVALYQSIIDLSKMFHYTLRAEDKMVPMSKELAYLKAYLALQSIRFREDLTIEYDVDSDTEKLLVPHNFMQPIVENAFTHGFAASKEGRRIGVHIHRAGERIEIKLCNSGNVIGEQQCRRIMKGMRGGTSHGLSMVYSKLSHIYGEDFSLEITSDKTSGTAFLVEFPVMGEEETDD